VQQANVICRVPANDELGDAIPIAVGEFHYGTSTFGTADPEAAPCPQAPVSPGVWYRVIGTGGTLIADTCDLYSRYDTRISVYQGECGRALTCVTSNDDACGEQSIVSWVTRPDERYLLFVEGSFFGLRLTVPEACPVGRVELIEPSDGTVDARQPHPLNDPNKSQGLTVIQLAAPAGVDPKCWRICESPSNLPENSIIMVSENDGLYTLTLARPIAPGGALRIQYAELPGSTAFVLYSHPGNVNGYGPSDAEDVETAVYCLRENDIKYCGEFIDLNYSGAFNPADLITLLDLLNGAESFSVWNGVELADEIDCP
jgi:hypothetical protein